MARYAVRSEPVRFRAGDELVAACLYLPKLSRPQPGLLFVMAGGALESQALGMAERLAHVGYVTLAVDAYGGALEQPTAPLAPSAGAEAVLRAALAWLRGRPQVKDAFAGAFGIGAAGGLALRLATGDNPVQAAVSIDGEDVPADWANTASAPLLVVAAGARSVNEREAPQAVGGLSADELHEFVRYAGAGRGFFDERGATFRAAEAEDAWSRANKFFYKHLGEPG